MLIRKISLIILAFTFTGFNIFAGNKHPHILVDDNDKSGIIKKIKEQDWAKAIYDEHLEKVRPYVERHRDDPEWILSRYLMNRVEGKRYTHAYGNGTGHYLVDYSGDAPVPTVRVSTHKRNPVTEGGSRYIRPSIEELEPYDTSRLMWIMNSETNEKDLIDPQQFISIINGEINDLALSAAVIYWLRGDEKYARFAADILDQWARGAYYQEPVVGACRTGFLDIQTLGDNRYQSLILAYDFLNPFMKEQGYDMSYYQNVFEKFASTMAFRGFWNNNWYAAVSSTLVYASLNLDDPVKQDYYIQFFMEKDTINGSCGHLGLPTTVERWLTHDGHWKEPGGYHNFPVSNLIRGALALERNGYDVFRRFPELFEATYAMLKYSFPNLNVSAFGDTGRASQSPLTLDAGLAIAAKYERPELGGLMSAMNALIDGGKYKREESGLIGLLYYLPEFPETEATPYQWPRSGELEFARFYLQRNGMDEEYGMMYGVQGASYNHNHCNGMAMELYGKGEIMGLDAGNGPNYDHPLHQNYFSQWAAHNTVVAAGSSSSVPFSGAAGRKNIGQIEMEAMEPLPDKEAVSPFYSFTDTRYFDASTNTNKLRTMAIIRTSATSAYYVDIYRSDNSVSNDYIYHNIGDKVDFLNAKRQPLSTESAGYPLTGDDKPGFRYYSEVEKLEGYTGDLIGIFPVNDGEGNYSHMQVLMPGAYGRDYYRAKSPATRTAGSHYSGKPLPVFTIRTLEEAWSNPFITILEPFGSKGEHSVKAVEKLDDLSNSHHTVLKVINKDGSEQFIFQGNNPSRKISNSQLTFSGYFGVASLRDGQLEHLYLGEGSHISFGGVSIRAPEGKTSAELQIFDDDTYRISSNNPVVIDFGETGSIVSELVKDD